MATVIDSLLIELGLDTSQFDASQKKSVDELRKLDEQAQKTSKNTQKGGKDMAEGFNAAKDAVIGFATVLVGMKMIKDLVVDTAKSNVELGRSAHILNMSAQELKNWGQMAEETGGDVNSMTATIKGLQQSLVALKYGGASGELIKSASFLKAWGALDINKQTVDLYKLADAIVAFQKSHTEAETVNFAESLGLDQSALLLLEKGSDYLRKDSAALDELNGKINGNTEKAEQLNLAWLQIKRTIEGIKQSFFGWVADTLLKPPSPEDQAAWDRYDEIRKQKEAEKNGGTSSSNLPRNIRNNNPGNLKYNDYTKSLGATGADSGGFAIFASMEAGQAAQAKLLKNKYAQGLDTLHKLYYGSGNVKGWLGSGADLKDANSAIANTMKMTGLKENQHITSDQLAMVQRAMANNEGMIGSNVNAPLAAGKTVNSSVNIQNQVINTKATDANGIAKDMHVALQQNTLINAGIMGAD